MRIVIDVNGSVATARVIAGDGGGGGATPSSEPIQDRAAAAPDPPDESNESVEHEHRADMALRQAIADVAKGLATSSAPPAAPVVSLTVNEAISALMAACNEYAFSSIDADALAAERRTLERAIAEERDDLMRQCGERARAKLDEVRADRDRLTRELDAASALGAGK